MAPSIEVVALAVLLVYAALKSRLSPSSRLYDSQVATIILSAIILASSMWYTRKARAADIRCGGPCVTIPKCEASLLEELWCFFTAPPGTL